MHPLDISEGALAAFKSQLAKRESRLTNVRAIRLGIKGGGCSGFSYVIQFEDDQATERDVIWNVDDVTFIVDKKSLTYLSGSRVTWKKTLIQTGFEFENPHATSKCGCGFSFSAR